jgi:hypothetical protein
VSKDARHSYVLVIESGPAASQDESVRSLRALLKAAKRCYGFRCVSVERSQHPQAPQDASGQAQRNIDES